MLYLETSVMGVEITFWSVMLVMLVIQVENLLKICFYTLVCLDVFWYSVVCKLFCILITRVSFYLFFSNFYTLLHERRVGLFFILTIISIV